MPECFSYSTADSEHDLECLSLYFLNLRESGLHERTFRNLTRSPNAHCAVDSHPSQRASSGSGLLSRLPAVYAGLEPVYNNGLRSAQWTIDVQALLTAVGGAGERGEGWCRLHEGVVRLSPNEGENLFSVDKAVGCGRRVKRVRVLRGSFFATSPCEIADVFHAGSRCCCVPSRAFCKHFERMLRKVIAHTKVQIKNNWGVGGKLYGSRRRVSNQTNNVQ